MATPALSHNGCTVKLCQSFAGKTSTLRVVVVVPSNVVTGYIPAVAYVSPLLIEAVLQ